MKYELVSVRSMRDYNLMSPAQEKVGSLQFPKWYKNEAHCRWGERKAVIKPTNIWGTHFGVIYQEEEIGKIHMNWKGFMQFSLHLGSMKGNIYMLKIANMFSMSLLLQTKEGASLLRMKPTYNWKKWMYNYELSPIKPFMGEGPDEFFLIALVCGYSARNLLNSGVA